LKDMRKRSLIGRAAIITGASQGLGLEIARAFVSAGASILLCARNVSELDAAYREVSSIAGPDQVVLSQVADVSCRADVDRLFETAFRVFPRLHVLVNNAGIYGPKGLIEENDWNEWVHAIEINLFGSILCCRAALPHFRQNHYGKIIQLSGGGATNPLPRLSAYAASKAAIVRFAETLAEEVRDERIDVNAIAPGALNTRLLDEILAAGSEKVGRNFYERSLQQKEKGGAPPEKGAKLAVFLAGAESDGITGKLLSAVWDPWEALPQHLEELRKTDIFTLRRIVPKDRGYAWGEL
jgi:NAD(P)-dependent dehydrogenase (short-subunit alcohol dehydrogenase family)